MTRLYLVRDGEVEANREMRYLGRRDDQMTGRGREQAAAFATLFESVGLGLAAARRMFLDQGTVSVVDWSRIPVLRLFNSHAHFGWPNARWMETRHGVSAAD